MSAVRDFGRCYAWDGGKLWFHPAHTPIKANLVLEELDEVNSQKNFSAYILDCFIITEAYILDYEVNDPDDLVFYLHNRSGSYRERYNLFVQIMSYNSLQFIQTAYQSTRPTDVLIPPGIDEKKELNGSSPKPGNMPESDTIPSERISSKAAKSSP
jgi:hypothetical protein